MTESIDHGKLRVSHSLPISSYRKKANRANSQLTDETENEIQTVILPQIKLLQLDEEATPVADSSELCIQTDLKNEITQDENQTPARSPSIHVQTQLDDSNPTTSSTLLSTANRLRNDSFKQFTEKFRSFSIDIFRSIELAHDMAEIRNQKFSTATQTAAVQLYTTGKHKNEADLLNTGKYGDDLEVTSDENELTPNNSLKVPSINYELENIRASISSNENKYSNALQNPIATQTRPSQKYDSSFDKAFTNLNRNSLIEKRNRIQESNGFKGEDMVDIQVRTSANKGIF